VENQATGLTETERATGPCRRNRLRLIRPPKRYNLSAVLEALGK
jgi:hypothetical protein